MIRALLIIGRLRRRPASAEQWAVRAQSADLSHAEQRAFDAWLKADPRNAEAYARCNKVGHLASRLGEHTDLLRSLPAYQALRRTRMRAPRSTSALVVVGAACAGALAVLIVTLLPHMLDRGSDTIVTAHGEQRQVPLSDGSRVAVNTGSELTIAFSSRERRVELKHGEAFFEVSRDPGRPFVVKAGRSEVRVVGTKFGVRYNGDRTEVVVTEGKVKVIADTSAPAAPGMTSPIELLPGNALEVDRESERVKVAVLDTERATSWRSGTIEFDESSLAEVIAEVNRYTTKQFVIEDERLKSIRLSGHFRIGDANSVKFALEEAFRIQAVERGDEILLQSRR